MICKTDRVLVESISMFISNVAFSTQREHSVRKIRVTSGRQMLALLYPGAAEPPLGCVGEPLSGISRYTAYAHRVYLVRGVLVRGILGAVAENIGNYYFLDFKIYQRKFVIRQRVLLQTHW